MSVGDLRSAILAKVEGSRDYDPRDVAWIKESDSLLKQVLAAHKVKGDVDKGVKCLETMLKFRMEYEINSLREGGLHPELLEKNAVYLGGKDKNGHQIVIFKVCKHTKGKLVKESKAAIAWLLNSHYRENPEHQIVLIFDFFNAGIGNMDLDVTKFIVKDATDGMFPNIAAYSLMFKMPFALEAIWKIIKGWLDEEQNKKTIFVKRTNIQEYIDPTNLEPHMIKEDKKQ